MTRVSDWPKVLNEFIQERLYTPFKWGTNDCCIFAGDAVLAITGTDLVAEFRGKYQTEDGSKKAIGGATVAGLVTQKLGKPVHWTHLQRGDVAMFEQENGKTLGLCVGAKLVTPGEDGLVFTSIDKAILGWRIL